MPGSQILRPKSLVYVYLVPNKATNIVVCAKYVPINDLDVFYELLQKHPKNV